MKIDVRQPRYVLPLLVLPFLCLFFYVFHGNGSKPQAVALRKDSLNTGVGNVAAQVRKQDLASKLDAFRNTIKEGTGASAVNNIPAEISMAPVIKPPPDGQRRLDSLHRLLDARFSAPKPVDREDEALAALRRQAAAVPRTVPAKSREPVDKDPMEVFKQQMAYMDSVNKAHDPDYQAQKAKQQKADALARAGAAQPKFGVTKAGADDEGFNTIRPDAEPAFIKAMIDEDITGHAGSRLRLRLLDDIRAGGYLITKGTELFAEVTGFSGQRVSLTIPSIMSGGKIFPVKLLIYDLDGLPGLYVPQSAFREFTKDLGGNSVQGVAIDGGSGGNQFLMSSVDKLFQSTSTAIAGVIRKNNARLKYNTFLYLIDGDALRNDQKAY